MELERVEVGGAELWHGDCLDLLEAIDRGSVDLVLADPPYCSGGETRTARKQATSKKYQSSDALAKFADFENDTMDERAYVLFTMEWARRARRAMREGASLLCFTDWRQLSNVQDALQAAGLTYRGIVVWDKGGARPQPNSFRNQCEFVVWVTNGAIDRTPAPGAKYLPGVFRVPTPGNEREHMNQKPVDLLGALMGIADRGGLVLDPFMGSGSTAVACLRYGYRFVGAELSDHYFAVACKRVGDEASQGRLFQL